MTDEKGDIQSSHVRTRKNFALLSYFRYYKIYSVSGMSHVSSDCVEFVVGMIGFINFVKGNIYVKILKSFHQS